MNKIIFLIVLLAIGLNSSAQEETNFQEVHHTLKGSHRISLGLGHTHLSNGQKDESSKNESLSFASWSLNYDYWISDKWAIGLQNDIVLETFLIENNDKEVVERSRPLSVVPVAIFKPWKHLSFIGGIGTEFAEEKNISLTRLGIDLGFHLPENWEAGAAFVWDAKWKHYDTWTIEFTFSKLLKKNNNRKIKEK